MAATKNTKDKDAASASASTDDQELVKGSLQDGSASAPQSPQVLVPNATLAAPPFEPLDEVIQDEQLPRYYVTDVSSVLHDGQWYHMGDDISLSDTEAGPLLQRRIIEPIQEFNQ
ncbi:hypothetical protein BLL42_01830 [Pseudomonas frederiksbergensis]|uniref:Uncharacterized protein n=1 Tax=Pseudomonas frederiksbergensis TaxID=104087 RepID=A0A1J0EFF0_9PSED|nr:hypothetical protein [Pseudomonas frederiksbergensis]APC14532.1 hypothetical protein BLL42_01830 [Pseudomonas frederiksbergensis]